MELMRRKPFAAVRLLRESHDSGSEWNLVGKRGTMRISAGCHWWLAHQCSGRRDTGGQATSGTQNRQNPKLFISLSRRVPRSPSLEAVKVIALATRVVDNQWHP